MKQPDTAPDDSRQSKVTKVAAAFVQLISLSMEYFLTSAPNNWSGGPDAPLDAEQLQSQAVIAEADLPLPQVQAVSDQSNSK